MEYYKMFWVLYSHSAEEVRLLISVFCICQFELQSTKTLFKGRFKEAVS